MIWKLVQLTPALRLQQLKDFSHGYPDTLDEGTWLACDGEICWSVEQLHQHLTIEQHELDYRKEIESVIHILGCVNEFCSGLLRNPPAAETDYGLNA